jgi:hypothetical protein
MTHVRYVDCVSGFPRAMSDMPDFLSAHQFAGIQSRQSAPGR